MNSGRQTLSEERRAGSRGYLHKIIWSLYHSMK